MADPAPTPTPKRSTLTPDYQRDWPSYFDAVKDQPPRDTLLRALAAFEREPAPALPRLAIDLACGEGRDTREMLHRGWRVLALDADPEGVGRTLSQLDPAWAARCTVRQMTMEEVPSLLGSHSARAEGVAEPPGARLGEVRPPLPPHASLPAPYLINASFALPFCRPEAFPALWHWISRTLAPGGRFSGQFFGDRDEWARVRPKSHFTPPQIVDLLAAFAIEHLEEVEKDGSDAMGGTKHHHVFHVVARKR